MSEIEFAIWIMAFIIIWLPILSNLIWWWDDRKDPENIGNNWEKYYKQAENNTKHNKKLIKIKRELKKQLLQKQIKEKEIEKLDFDSSTDFNSDNDTKIQELELEIEDIDDRINDLDDKIYNINREIQWISMY